MVGDASFREVPPIPSSADARKFIPEPPLSNEGEAQEEGEVGIGSLPSFQRFGGANGGEFRKSFHGYAPPFAQLIRSPKTIQITPMQIDT